MQRLVQLAQPLILCWIPNCLASLQLNLDPDKGGKALAACIRQSRGEAEIDARKLIACI